VRDGVDEVVLHLLEVLQERDVAQDHRQSHGLAEGRDDLDHARLRDPAVRQRQLGDAGLALHEQLSQRAVVRSPLSVADLDRRHRAIADRRTCLSVEAAVSTDLRSSQDSESRYPSHTCHATMPDATGRGHRRGHSQISPYPLGHWFRDPLRPLVRDVCEFDAIRRGGSFAGTVERLMLEHESQRRHHRRKLSTLLAFQLGAPAPAS
jgi:hypothetical protein